MDFKHIPVLLEPCIDALCIKPDGVYVDGTLGGAGHSRCIAEKLQNGRLIGIDQDENAIKAATAVLQDYDSCGSHDSNVTIVHNNFKNVNDVLQELGVDAIDGALLDLGVSSAQLDQKERGFSYLSDFDIDMRMNPDAAFSAYNIVNEYSERELTDIIYKYGEERWAKRIAQFIAAAREKEPVRTTGQLVKIIEAAIPAAARAEGGHPAKRTFQALRIETNNELGILDSSLRAFADKLKSGGRLAVITFHSLEDRIVKETFADLASGCNCPKSLPVCVCGNQPKVKLITKKPITASEEELNSNSRAKSAKLRVIEKL